MFYAHGKRIKDSLIKRAEKYCEENVHDWKSMDDQKREWYLKKVSRFFLEDKDILKEMFKLQLN